MNKKYLILKSNTVSMHSGGLTGWFGSKKSQLWGSGTAEGGWVRQSKKDDILNSQLPKDFLDITDPNAQRDAMDKAAESAAPLLEEQAAKNEKNVGIGNVATDAALAIGGIAGNAAINNFAEKVIL